MPRWRSSRKRGREAVPARPDVADCTLAMWLVAAFLGGFVAAHYVVGQLVSGGADAAPAMTFIASLL